jgi:hypothetical protein
MAVPSTRPAPASVYGPVFAPFPSVGFPSRISDNQNMNRTIQRIPRHQQQATDLAFWLARPMAERLAAVEALRLQATDVTESTDAQPRLQRICRITQRQRR